MTKYLMSTCFIFSNIQGDLGAVKAQDMVTAFMELTPRWTVLGSTSKHLNHCEKGQNKHERP